MTIYGWDASHYDGTLTRDILDRAAAEGIEFFTHKLGEGLGNTDDTAGPVLTAARDAGIKVIGGYYFIHSGDMVAQARRCVVLADAAVPWWRDFPGWFWQTDAETDTSGHLPAPAEVKQFSDVLAQVSGRTVVVYASHGMYGDRLAGLGHPLWNANYPSARRAPFKDLYPGDDYPGWTPYSGQTPVICQYTSSATIGGRTTCDANAFRGTIAQLQTLIGDTTVAGFDANDAHFLLTYMGLPATNPVESLGTAVLAVQNSAAATGAKVDALTKAVADIAAKVNAIVLAGGQPPAAPSAAAIAAEIINQLKSSVQRAGSGGQVL